MNVNIDLKKMYEKYIIKSFCEKYNVTKKELNENNHFYFRFLCFLYLDFIRNIEMPKINLGSRYEAVFIEFRILPHVEFIIRNAILKLGSNWSYTIICGNKNYDFFCKICSNISPNLNIIKIDLDNLLVNDYNNLLTSLEFWKMLNGEKILIYQEDSIMFKNNINDFLIYDYIGAPFPKNQNDTPNLVGNGGFSLRSKSKMIDIINSKLIDDTIFNSSTTNYMKNNGLTVPPEDVYFSKNMQELNIGVVASHESALSFSTESVANKNSLGGHKFWIGNSEWKKIMKNKFDLIEYKPQSNLLLYLKYYNISEVHSKIDTIPNAFDIDLYFCDAVNNLLIGKNEDIIKYIKNIGLNGFIYHPKQILNIFPNIVFYKFMKNLFIMYKFTIYKSSEFINKFIYKSNYNDLKSRLIKQKYYNLNNKIELLIVAFIGNENRGIDLINKIINYKNIQEFNISFCFNNLSDTTKYTDKIKNLIKTNFEFYSIYNCKELGTDITPTLLMCDDILNKHHNFNHIIKLHTKSISSQYSDLTDFILSMPLSNILSNKIDNCNCIGHPKYYINITSDNFNNELFIKYSNSINIKKSFVGGTIFYINSKVLLEVINFIIKNNYRSYFLNNLYENNCINKDYSPIHFIERLFGVIKI
jgi:hypothetical protein